MHANKTSRAIGVGLVIGVLLLSQLSINHNILGTVLTIRGPERTFAKNWSISQEDVCNHSSSSEPVIRSIPAVNISVSKIVGGPGLNSSGVCEYNLDTFHFPHATQEILRCWSFWRATTKPPVLYINVEDPTGVKRKKGGPFLEGLLNCLTAIFNVSIATNSSEPTVRPKMASSPFAVSKVADVGDLRRGILSSQALPYDRGLDTSLRVGLLNRKSTRSILNIQDLAHALERVFSAKVTITDFEEASFQEQVAFYANHEIVISGHGAQLTGALFMEECGAVFEIFPKGYFLPYYFGSLTQISGLLHGFLYMSPGDPANETKQAKRSLKSRSLARSASFCLPLAKIVRAVAEMVDMRAHCLAGLSRPS